MFQNPPVHPLPVPPTVIVLGLAIVGFAVGIAWLRRITGQRDDPDARADRYRDRFR
jgi:hypothetical protein